LLVNNRFYAHLSQRLGLAEKVIAVNPESRRSARVHAGVFEAYIGGMHRELGLAGHERLFQWFRGVIEEYAQRFYEQLGCGISDSKDEKEEGQTWTAWLHEFAGKRGLPMPEYIYNKRGAPHLPIWECTVFLSGQKHGVAEGGRQKEAREKACERTWSGLHTKRAPGGASGRDI
jgi:dsRNA-specific ribonuclease